MPEIGDDDGGGEPDVESSERHYRITLDFRLLLRPFTPEPCRDRFFDRGSALAREPHSGEEVERQRRLYALLRKNKDVLERYLLTVIANEAVGFVFGGLVEAFGLAEDEGLLAPLYAQMSEGDAEYIEGRAGEGRFWESTELVAKAFVVEWVGAECAKMSRRVVGDLTKAGGRRAGEDARAPAKER
ncbi:MAG TPA: hypothetical protein VF654_11770 [Pyrinomonadaceae bacterium]